MMPQVPVLCFVMMKYKQDWYETATIMVAQADMLYT